MCESAATQVACLKLGENQGWFSTYHHMCSEAACDDSLFYLIQSSRLLLSKEVSDV